MALKGILKNKHTAAPEAGPSKPRHAGAGGRTGAGAGGKGGNAGKSKAKATMSVPAPKDKGKARKPAVESDEDEDEDVDMSSGEEEELDTEDEIERAQAGSEKKPLKRKRVTTAADFGSTLATLLSEPATKKSRAAKLKADKLAEDAGGAEPPSKPTDRAAAKSTGKGKPAAAPILALSAKPLPPSQAAERLERRAARALKAEKEERLDRARVRNVLEGWTPAEGADVGSQEFERALRKTAQRGVIKLFNAILVASRNAEAAAKTLADKAGVKPEAPKSRKEKDNILGRGAREDALTKESFLDLVRKGGSR